MAKISANDFFNTSSAKPESKVKKLSADDFFNSSVAVYKEKEKSQIAEASKQVLKNTITSVTKQTEKPYAIDFKAAQAKSKQEPKPDPKKASDFSKDMKEPQGKLPAASFLGSDKIQSALKGKLPAASLITNTGGGPANASKIPGVSQYEINKKEIANDNVPKAVKAFANTMNYVTEGNPIGVAVGNAFSGNSGATRKDSSGNKTVDKITGAINNFVTPILTPTGAGVGQGIIGSSYDAAGKVLGTGTGMKGVNAASKFIPFANGAAAQNIARVGLTEGLAGAAQGAEFGVQHGQDTGKKILKNAGYGAAGGTLLGVGGAAVGEGFGAILNRFRKSGLSDAEIADIAPEILSLPEANPRTVRKQEAGQIKGLVPNGDAISTPYTFKLNEATPETQTASASRQGANREAVKVIDPVSDTRYQQSVIDEYKRLKADPTVNLSNKNTYELATKNMEANKPNNPIVTSKLKDTRINGEPTPYKEPTIRDTSTLTREQDIYNRVLKGEQPTQDDIDFMLSDNFKKENIFPEDTLKESTYVKPIKAEVKPSVKAEVAATTELKPVKKVTAIKTSVKSIAEAKNSTPGVRANYKTMADSGNISATLKRNIGKLDQKYEVSKNADVVSNSNKAVENLSQSESNFLTNESGGAQHISDGYRVMQELDKSGQHARALAIADKLAKDLTKAGQTTQAASLIQRLSPEGQLLNLVRTASKAGKTVEVADKVKFQELAVKVQDNANAGLRENSVNDILDKIAKGEKVTAEEVSTLSDLLSRAESKLQSKPKVVKDKLPKELNDVKKREKVISFLEEAEAAAQRRIDKRRGRLNSMPIAEWTDYSILIAAKVGKGVIKAETHIEDLVKSFGEEIRPYATQIFEKAQELVNGVTKSTIEGDFFKANNAFKRITGQVNAGKQERIVEKYIMENPKVSPKDIESLRNLSKSLTELSGNVKQNADMEMQKILNSYEKSSVMDKVNALRYIAMLYNSGTQAINAASGPIMATTGRVADVFGSMIDVTLSKAMKTPRTTTLYGGNPVRFMADYFKALKVGAKAGWEGVNPAGIQGANEIRGLTYNSLYNPLSWAERSLGAVAKGADYAAYSAIHSGEMRKQAFLDGLENGIKRSDKADMDKHIRKFINDPSEIALEQADRIAKNATFQRNDTLGGEAANWLNSGTGKVKTVVSPIVRTVFPFVRTPVNIASTAVTISPGGIIKGLIQLSSKSNATQREAIRTLSLGLTGTGLSAVGFYLHRLGIITGSNDSGDKNADNIRDQAGKGKYRFNTSALSRYMGALFNGEGADAAEKAAKYQKGDKAFDYNKLQPLAFPLSIGAEFSGSKGKSIDKRITGTVSGASGSLLAMSTLRGLQDAFQPQYGGTQGEKAAGIGTRLGESFLKSFSPSMLAQEARRQDPVVRKTPYNDGIIADVKGYYKSRTPWGVSETLPANKTTLGQDKKNAPGIMGQYANPYKSEMANYTQAATFIVDLMDRTGDDSIAPKPPEKKVEGKNADDVSVSIDIPKKRYEKLQEDIGNEIINRVMEIEAGTDAEQVTELEDIYAEVRKQYMDEVKEELGIIVD